MLVWLSLATANATETVASTFPPPAAYERVAVSGPFGEHVRALPLRPSTEPVKTFDGAILTTHRARVIDLPMVSGDLQQCADSILRVRAEWLREQGLAISFHATSGDPLPYTRWLAGERPYELNGKIAWKMSSTGGWESYLSKVFMWAGTRSLALDTAQALEPQPGDILVAPGSPGHAVLLLDVAKRGAETLVLVAEGYMPAQSFHVEIGPHEGWWSYDDGVSLPHWDLPASGLRRF